MEELTPITRREVFLAKAAGQEVETPTPVTREEVFLDAIAKRGGGSSLPPVTSQDNGKVLAVEDGAWAAGVQEYWIPVTTAGSGLGIPGDEEIIVSSAIQNPDEYFVRGIVIDGTTYLAGYVENMGSFIVPIDKSTMSRFFGFDCAGKIRIEDDDGYVVKVVPDKYIVTLTPTSLDYSGTMDKTVAEINAACEAGHEIWFKVAASGYDILIPMSNCSVSSSFTYPSFDCRMADISTNVEVFVRTAATNDGTKQTYSTRVYALTPAS